MNSIITDFVRRYLDQYGSKIDVYTASGYPAAGDWAIQILKGNTNTYAVFRISDTEALVVGRESITYDMQRMNYNLRELPHPYQVWAISAPLLPGVELAQIADL